MDLDSTYLKQVQSQDAYDYISELNAEIDKLNGSPQGNGTSTSTRSVSDLKDDFMDFVRDNATMFNIITFLMLGFAAFFLIRHLLRSYFVDTDTELCDDSPLGSDTIEGHDWDKEIASLMEHERYGEVVVLCYLRWLNNLNGQGIIQFDVSKTPGILIAEVEEYMRSGSDTKSVTDVASVPEDFKAETIEKTKVLTRNYLRIRYGHKSADCSLANNMLQL